MRSVEPSNLVRALAEVLEEQVIPLQTDKHTKSTLWMIVGLLDNISQRINEDPRQVEFEESILSGLLRSEPGPIDPGAPRPHPRHGLTAAEPVSVRAMNQPTVPDREVSSKHQLSQVLRGIAHDRARLDSPDTRQWLIEMEDGLRRLVARRASLTRPTRYMRALDP